MSTNNVSTRHNAFSQSCIDLQGIVQVNTTTNSPLENFQKEINDPLFIQAIESAYERQWQRKGEIEKRLVLLNGEYYQDPASLMHRAYLRSNVSSKEFEDLKVEKDSLENELNGIKNDPLFRKYTIEKNLKELCGAYYGDPNGLLDRSWRAYQKGQSSLDEHQALERRKLALENEKSLLQDTLSRSALSKNDLVQQQKTLAFDGNLKSWCEESAGSSEYQQRIEASTRIRKCYNERAVTLNLFGLGISSLPTAIGELTQLTEFNAEENQIKALPETIGQLIQLEVLTLASNQLETLPSTIGQMQKLRRLHVTDNQLETLPTTIGQLTQLTYLGLSSNKLRTLPPEIGQLTRLEVLYATHNRLQTLPSEIGQMRQLKEINLSFNFLYILPPEIGQLERLRKLYVPNNQLQSLPDSCIQLSRECIINAEQNHLILPVIQHLENQIDLQRAQNSNLGPIFRYSIFELPAPTSSTRARALTSSSTLKDAMSFWLDQFQKTFKDTPFLAEFPQEMFVSGNLENHSFYQPIFQLSHEQQDNVKEFLNRLQRTEDFRHPMAQRGIILRAMRMLHGACTHEEFRQKLSFILGEALSSCGDRVTIYFDQIELQWQLYLGAGKMNEEKLARLLVGARRLDILNGVVRKKIEEKGLGDAIEVLLFCQLRLKDALGLPVTTEGMLYPAMAGISDEELAEMTSDILKQTSSPEQAAEILASSDLWQKRMQREQREQFDKINEPLSEQILRVSEESAQEQEKLDRIKALSSEQKTMTLDLVRKLTQEWIQKVQIQF